MTEKILYPSKLRTIVYGAISLIVGLLTVGTLISFLCLAASVIFASMLVPGLSYLKLTPEGFTFRHLFGEKIYRWSDIEEFRLITKRWMGIIPVHRSIGWVFSDAYRKRGLIQKAVKALARVEGQLPDSYGMKAKDLGALMEALRREAAKTNAPVAQPWVSAAVYEPRHE